MRQVCVLYEDERAPQKGFGLHELAKACVRDHFEHQPREDIDEALKDCRPLGGDTKVLKKFREDVDTIAADGRPVVAVFDNDRIRRLLKLPAKATDARVIEELLKDTSSERLHVILLNRNMESVIKAAHECDPSIDKERVDLAIKQKDRLERDAILARLTGAQFRAVRDCIREKLPSFQELVDLLCELIQRPARSRKKS
jgi:hypothetical protein